MKKNVFLLVMVSIIISSCIHRYEDGPNFSLTSVEKRLQRTWKIDKYYYNGADSTAYFNSLLPNYRIVYRINDTYEVFINDGETYSFGTFFLPPDRERLLHQPNDQIGETEYQILRLTKKEFWRKTDVDEMHLVAIDE